MSCTGYKIGWVYGPANLVDAAARAHQFISYAVVTPLQEAVAVALEKADTTGYWKQFASDYIHRRDVMLSALRSAGFNPIVPQGTFFVTCDVSNEVKRLPPGWGTRDHETITRECFDLVDWNFCRWLTAEVRSLCRPNLVEILIVFSLGRSHRHSLQCILFWALVDTADEYHSFCIL
jgi:aspartate/methionine/tyrosine aminotransferase